LDGASDSAAYADTQFADPTMTVTSALLVVYVDVDDTLVRSVGSKRIPIVRVVEHVRQLKAGGATLHCWSSGGADYARQSAVELGIEHCFQSFLSKPNVMIDDQAVADWKLCLEVHPQSIDGCGAEQYWEGLKAK
jgi:hypothetical protein